LLVRAAPVANLQRHRRQVGPITEIVSGQHEPRVVRAQPALTVQHVPRIGGGLGAGDRHAGGRQEYGEEQQEAEQPAGQDYVPHRGQVYPTGITPSAFLDYWLRSRVTVLDAANSRSWPSRARTWKLYVTPRGKPTSVVLERLEVNANASGVEPWAWY